MKDTRSSFLLLLTKLLSNDSIHFGDYSINHKDKSLHRQLARLSLLPSPNPNCPIP